MTAGVASGIANSILDTNFDDQYIQLHTGDPGAAGTSSISVGSTTRIQAVTPAASGGSKTIADVGPWTNGGTSETITHYSIWSASSGGTFKGSCALAASKAWVSTDTLTIDVTIAVTPIAA